LVADKQMNFARGSKVGYSGPNLNDSNESSSLNGYHNNASSSSSSSSSGSRHVSFEDSNDQWDHYRMERGLGKKNLQWMPYLTMFGTMISFFAVGVLVTNRLSSSGFAAGAVTSASTRSPRAMMVNGAITGVLVAVFEGFGGLKL
jgi:hypothetical protein